MEAKTPPTVDIATLRRQLAEYPDDFEVSFGGLEFVRVKQRGPNLVQIEFTQNISIGESGNVILDKPFLQK